MYEKDILRLAAHLAKVPRRGFDMSSWSRVVDGKSIKECHVEQEFECGMAACLGGHAAVVFPHRLKLKSHNSSIAAHLYSRDNQHYGHRAFAKAFDLCSMCAMELVNGTAPHNTPKRAIRTLQRLVVGKGWETGGADTRKSSLRDCHFHVYNCSG